MASRMNRVWGSTIGMAAAMFMAAGGLASTLTGCDQPPKEDGKQATKDGGKGDGKAAGKDGSKSPASDEKPKPEPVTIAGKDFKLEPALDRKVRFHGLSGRTEISPDGGMLFAFTSPQNLYFVMRDCPIPIDIIFLDATGRVTAMHKMTPETPRTDEEKKMTAPYAGAEPWEFTNEKYEARLKRYPSKYDAQFVIELKGGTLDGLKLKEGDQVKLDVAGLKKRAE